MIKISYKITAVRSREQYALELARMIGEPESSIMWDEELKGSQWNKNRTYEEFLKTNKYTHLLLLDDDAIVVNDFKKIVEMAVVRFPSAIWTFFDNTHEFKHRPKNTPYIELFNKNARGIALLMPRQHIDPYLEFYKKEFATRYPAWNHDDTAKKMFALLNDIPVMATIPSLVYARQVKSAIPTHHNITPNTSCWQGRDIDIGQFSTLDYEVDKIRQLFMTHLNKNEPICVRCSEKFKRMKMLEKL